MQPKYTKYKPLAYDKSWDLLLSDLPDSETEVKQIQHLICKQM